MVLEATDNDRRKLLGPCNDPFRGPRSDTGRQVVSNATTTSSLSNTPLDFYLLLNDEIDTKAGTSLIPPSPAL
ncbi:hypothetical protein TNCV_3910621 [Trichonephila clavipes]|nr:hypothetical protein TNCV_3910621 [Trichonephila clavipes]